jgi:hypothetical protein
MAAKRGTIFIAYLYVSRRAAVPKPERLRKGGRLGGLITPPYALIDA